eukprot:TRINITY_DN2598_c0_g1_i3.p1 TRINITY_DN2598_c0_g1~~TRINITY_DN2598_c0_g1_i3.p1  ORF type:complete len:692 (-),score=195.94 TRINITY_DN2598_c0_g1_i3:33-1940(-)
MKPVEVVLEQWKVFDFPAKRSQWDALSVMFTKNKKDRLAGRKRLAKETKEFKSSTGTDQEKLTLVSNLIPLYQEEVDILTKRCKEIESDFSKVLEQLKCLADPFPVLFALQEDKVRKETKLSELESEANHYRSQVGVLQNELSIRQEVETNNQKLEASMRENTAKLDGALKANSILQADLEGKSKELSVLRDRDQDHIKATDHLKEELARSSAVVRDLQGQLLDTRSSFETQLVAKQNEVDVLSAEVEKAASTLEVDKMQRVNEGDSQSKHLDGEVVQLQLQLAQRDIQIKTLAEGLSATQEELKQSQETLTKKVSELTENLVAEKTRNESLQHELPSREKYMELLEQLEAYKRAMEVEESGDSESQGATTAEKLLKEKNRRLETETIQLKMNLRKLEADVASVHTSLQQSENERSRLTALSAKLEEQLSIAYTSSQEQEPSPAEETVVDELVTPRAPGAGADTASALSPAQGAAAGSGAAIIDILIGQRDRMKERVERMEAERYHLQQDMDQLRVETKKLKEDNVTLFQKLKYVRSYQDGGARPHGEQILESPLEQKYESLYEQKVNPFAEFNSREKDQQYRRLNSTDKVILRFGRFCMGNQYARIGLLGYFLLLHLFVFIVAYKTATTQATGL